jgi:hypothetical protein
MTQNINTTVTSNSNFRHLANALEKRGYYHTAGYVVGRAHGAKRRDLTALEVYQTAERAALLDILRFLRDEADVVPVEITKGIAWLESGVAPGYVIELVPDPFQAVEDEGRVTVELTVTEAKALRALYQRGALIEANEDAVRGLGKVSQAI